MTSRTVQRIAGIATVIVSTSLLGGCFLSAEENDVVSSVSPDDPGTPTNSAPTISGNPPSAITMGNTYSFVPTANDADGDTLTFSVENLPAWASFSTTSGEVSGEPSLADIGVFSNLVVSVSDGQESDSLPAYSITVSQSQLGSMSLSWTPPTQNSDGSTLTDLAGYRIYYGLSEGLYPNRADINNPSVSTFVVDNLAPDTYFVVATSVNAAGIESAQSNVAQKVVQ